MGNVAAAPLLHTLALFLLQGRDNLHRKLRPAQVLGNPGLLVGILNAVNSRRSWRLQTWMPLQDLSCSWVLSELQT